MVKVDLDLIIKIQKYFDIEIVGSFLFYNEGLLDLGSIGDVDILVASDKEFKRLNSMLVDNGYFGKEDRYSQTITKKQVVAYKYRKVGCIPIHVIPSIEQVAPLPDIVAYKFKRASASDIVQLREIMSKLLPPKGK